MAAITGQISTEMGVTWKIRDFFRITAKEGSRLYSPSFYLAGADWRIELYPNPQYILISLRRLKNSVARQTVEATFSLKNRDSENCARNSVNIIYSKTNNCVGKILSIPRLMLEKRKDSLLPDGTLTVHCQMRVEPSSNDRGSSEEESSNTANSVEEFETGASVRRHLDASSQTESPDACKGDGDLQTTSPSVSNLQTDNKKLLESKEGTDVFLKVSEKEFPALTCFLRARSSVFSVLLKHDTEEKNSGEMVIKNLDPESFPDILRHLYAGSVDTFSVENIINLYIAADKYDMADLKSECKSYMERNLSEDTFCDVMILALRYKEDELLKVATDFFCKNLTKIIVTVKWQMFLKEYDVEVNELLIKALVPANEK